ncbi:4-(cytidine 5'-diphospho)-2-C-methyl-D-erythritol kinase [Ilyomonas limi]|uniref:4-diphosphocytidyl-2-C-methyl-D-erythritol kinase n=1 Tax=Ilyomonas limi TaxID=2575867 RepID=A0A4U3KUV8_9BACT|nr:4-(cytidine 5'-diphospho)-2-C-methyl-D-erythritol kinase [Ilyomonas limi]TKK65324.1 4-(cytidine 5'-diphospho)-2-C-methyl-D-erythritol kinase [Ilyomonas limi]
MVTFPNCKINIGLHIIGKRGDGFHNLETVFYPLPLYDCLEIITLPNNEKWPVLTMSGLSIDGTAANNICLKAWQLLKSDFTQLPAVAIHLHKAIPMGAGLGGGSADGAFMLKMLNEKCNLQLSEQQLIQYALQLGSDCPFFIINTPCFGSGRGEVLQPIHLNLSAYYFVIINPAIHVNTGWAFQQLQIQTPAYPLLEAIQHPVDTWKASIVNDFEKVVATQYPAIAQVKETLYRHGAVYASMTGSGSTIFGLFAGKPSLPAFPDEYVVKVIPPNEG